MDERQKEQFFTEFNHSLHRMGKILLIISLVLLLSVPFVIGLLNGLMPELDGFLSGIAKVGIIYIPVAIVEFLVYTPMLGVGGSFISFLTGNLTNMKIKTLLSTLLVMFAAVSVTAQIESGKVYRMVNKLYGTVAAESAVNNTINCEKRGTSSDWQQLWIITETATESLYTIQNVYTGRNLHFESATNNPFYTVKDENYALFINDNSSYFSGCYAITISKNSNWAMHCASNSVCVPWNTNSEGTNWTFEQVEITAEEIAEARKTYESFKITIDSESTYASER